MTPCWDRYQWPLWRRGVIARTACIFFLAGEKDFNFQRVHPREASSELCLCTHANLLADHDWRLIPELSLLLLRSKNTSFLSPGTLVLIWLLYITSPHHSSDQAASPLHNRHAAISDTVPLFFFIVVLCWDIVWYIVPYFLLTEKQSV